MSRYRTPALGASNPAIAPKLRSLEIIVSNDGEDDLAEALVGFLIAVGFLYVIDCKCFINHYAQLSGAEKGHDMLAEGAHDFGNLLDRTRAQDGTDEVGAAAVNLRHAQRDLAS